jgi:hypothetical protein
VGFCPLVHVRAIREGEYCETPKGRSDATELDSESEREALTDPSRGAPRRWFRSELRPSAHPQLGAPEQDRRGGQPVPGRLPPERLTSVNRLICLAACALAAAPASSAIAAKSGAPPHRFPWHERVRDVTRFLSTRTGAVPFAVVDERGRIHGYRRGVQYSSASCSAGRPVVRSMPNNAEPRRLGADSIDQSGWDGHGRRESDSGAPTSSLKTVVFRP